MADKRGDLTVEDLRRQTVKDALAEELAGKEPLLDAVFGMIDEDERKIAELERIAKEKGYSNAYGNNDVKLSGGKPSSLSLTITADVDEAVTGLKRLHRELRKTTQELRELERGLAEIADGRPISLDGPSIARSIAEYIEDVEDHAVKLWREKGDLSEVPTYALSEELARREGVREYRVSPEQRAVIHFSENDSRIDVDGPAVLLVNID